MRSKRPVLLSVILILSSIMGACVLCGIRNRYSLTDPPQDSLELTQHRDIRSEVGPMNVEAVYALGQKLVDEWSPGAYLYSIHLHTACTNFTVTEEISLHFLRINHLDIYTKQWYAFVKFDLEEERVTLSVEKEECDPPPPLQRRLKLEELTVDLSQVLQIANQVKETDGDCIRAHIWLHENEWNIRYVNAQYITIKGYPFIKINALTGEIRREESRFDY